MSWDLTGLGSAFDFGKVLINKIFPDPAEKAKAEALLMEADRKGELNEINANLQVMLAEAKSLDKWTSRARPSFLYVIYIMIVSAIPVGVIYAIKPVIAANIAMGVNAWLQAIPKELWTLFGIGYLGYTGAREFGKKKLLDTIGNISKK